MRNLLLGGFAALVLVACGQPPAATTTEAAPVETAAVEPAAPTLPANVFASAEGVAAGGYDVVSFFKGAPAAGTAEFVSEVEGVKYQFASAESKAEFDAAPANFLPQYGGFCAYGAAKGKKFPIDPVTGTVINGKLYFNLNQDVQKEFNKDQAGNISAADANWPNIQNDPIAG